ncbi:hypothetical protein ACFQVC_38915 [Streptomyces monticola]|uniref:SMI1/KNR4 family protein n=1 Tax=Streptomyces monticola TaxID=2666263 RepID=A0ABW2JXP9_9ACTN
MIRVHFTAEAPETVIERAREALSRVVERVESWPPESEWEQMLPAWFIERCAPEPTPDPDFDSAYWLARWRGLSPAEKAAAAAGPWTLSNWLYYFDPTDEGQGDDRSWWWWNAGTDDAHAGWIDVATTGWPFGTGSLYWLIEASGGSDPRY